MNNTKEFLPTITCRFEFYDLPHRAGLPKRARGDFFVSGDPNVIASETRDYTGTFKQFQIEFIRRMQDERILEAVSNGSAGIIAPENYIKEFWSPDFVFRLADALRRPRKRMSNINKPTLQLILTADWEAKKLCDLTKEKLAEFLNTTYGIDPPLTPAAIRKMAQRLGLFSTLDTQGK